MKDDQYLHGSNTGYKYVLTKDNDWKLPKNQVNVIHYAVLSNIGCFDVKQRFLIMSVAMLWRVRVYVNGTDNMTYVGMTKTSQHDILDLNSHGFLSLVDLCLNIWKATVSS